MTDEQREAYLKQLEKDKALAELLDELHKKMRVIAAGVVKETVEYGKRATALMGEIHKLAKNKRLKFENKEKRATALQQEVEQLLQDYEKYREAEQHREYMEMMSYVEVDVPKGKNVTEIKEGKTAKKRNSKKVTKIEGEQMALSLRGGRREGSGRKPIGERRTLAITLPPEKWAELEADIEKGNYKNMVHLFRSLVGVFD